MIAGLRFAAGASGAGAAAGGGVTLLGFAFETGEGSRFKSGVVSTLVAFFTAAFRFVGEAAGFSVSVGLREAVFEAGAFMGGRGMVEQTLNSI